jgi:hypothetical protein
LNLYRMKNKLGLELQWIILRRSNAF